ncbi:helix-turn-helix transcriptional regulator [Sinomicrobium weinanense]|uniref:Helix-turn-helix domain-containing protein n=1 Tax=Sinomicrobium weinanense TaxID=2842200 RepID=A0A926JRZ0_9FLAO|nr:helix-turn-helix domain-containing protein [Sinomicrobium weinanense]MBC9796279.1 helix-turn-helix domain-containing protein [Sinomicrobium weinanense]MBU3123240.1 helix-turn-helix domain-containing protein [Sinomicrobium weinanense]
MNNLELEERLERIEKLLAFNKRVLTFDEACDYTGISKSYLYKLTSENRIPFSKPNGKVIFFEREKLENWLLRNHRRSRQETKDEALSYVLKNKKV